MFRRPCWLIAATSLLICLCWHAPSAIASTHYTRVLVPGVGPVAIEVETPTTPRYVSGAPVLVYMPPFLSVDTIPQWRIKRSPAFPNEGMIRVSYLLPGQCADDVNHVQICSSLGAPYDYGGPDSLLASRVVLDFVTENGVVNMSGDTFSDWIYAQSGIVSLTDEVGLYAFSHPGILVSKVLSGGWTNSNIRWYVGGENPTEDVIVARDLGFGSSPNGHYNYGNYDSENIHINYFSVWWDTVCDCPRLSSPSFILDDPMVRLPNGNRMFSIEIVEALHITYPPGTWPTVSGDPPGDFPTVPQVMQFWEDRESVGTYGEVKLNFPDLKVMLAFFEIDHKQTAVDKPHVHQAWDGFFNGGAFPLWTRLNPEYAYAIQQGGVAGYTAHDANTEPSSWPLEVSYQWAYPGQAEAAGGLVGLAAATEMADRTHYNRWSAADDTLGTLLCDYPSIPCP